VSNVIEIAETARAEAGVARFFSLGLLFFTLHCHSFYASFDQGILTKYFE